MEGGVKLECIEQVSSVYGTCILYEIEDELVFDRD
jgi:hypothetical protein